MKYLLRLLIVVFLNICVWAAVGFAYGQDQPAMAVQAISKLGSRGTAVAEIQQELQNLGFYTDNIDGIFGQATATAVKRFQQDRGLTIDGVVGKDTLKALGLEHDAAPVSAPWSESDYQLLARLISAEARGEPLEGQVAVGAVILNRVEHPSFPDTIAGVAYQPGAFTAMTDGQFNQPIASSAYRAATEALNGSDPTGGAIYYYNPKKTKNKWMRARPVITVIGNHTFCA